MMAVVVDHVAAIGGVVPHLVGEEFVLGLGRPVVVILGMTEMQPLDLLEEDDVRIEAAQPLAQLVHHHAPVELREALVDIEGRYMK